MLSPRGLAALTLSCVLLLARDASAQNAAAKTVTLTGRVLTDSLEHPIVGARVAIPALNIAVTSDSTGRFRLPGIIPGRYPMLASHPGYSAFQATLIFGASDSVEVEVLMSADEPDGAQPIEKVKVTANRTPRGLDDFERRRRGGIGDFVMADAIAKQANGLFSDAVRRIPGIQLSRPAAGFGAYASAGRGATRGRPCYIAVMIDRSWVYEGRSGQLPFDLNSIQPETIAAMEYYRGSGYVPAEFGKERNTCGMLIIWTKRG